MWVGGAMLSRLASMNEKFHWHRESMPTTDRTSCFRGDPVQHQSFHTIRESMAHQNTELTPVVS
jgi:hypothetical protein